jgi:hypothetical protein
VSIDGCQQAVFPLLSLTPREQATTENMESASRSRQIDRRDAVTDVQISSFLSKLEAARTSDASDL